MRKPIKVAAWAAVFLASAGVGAFIAANTDPFPPGVDRPTDGPVASPIPSTTPGPKAQRWTGVIRTVARHDFYVGGACETRWRAVVRFRVDPRGAVSGRAIGRPIGDVRCDFPQAQVQSRTIRSVVDGRYSHADTIALVFKRSIVDPTGSSDLGGYLLFLRLPRLVAQTLDGKTAEGSFDKTRGDGDRGTYRFVGSVDLRCLSGCGQLGGP